MAEKVFSIRTDETLISRFKKISSEFENGSECFQALLNAHEMNQAKKMVPDQKTNIEDFQTRVDGVVRAYIAALDLATNTEERVRKEYEWSIDSKDKIIFDLQNRISELEVENQKLEKLDKENRSLENKLSAAELLLKSANEAVADKQSIINNLLERLPEQEELESLNRQLAQSKENEQKFKFEIQKRELDVREEYLEKIEKLQEQIRELNGR